MDLTAILNRLATDHGLLGSLVVILMVSLFSAVRHATTCYNERLIDLKSNHEIIGSFTAIQQQRQATIEAMVTQIGNMSRALDLAAQANSATISKIDRLGELANAAKASNEQMREAVATLRGK
jgi:hypothetical protein